MARLGDICEILDSKRIPITASNRKAGIYPYYGANGIQDYVDDYIFDDELVLLAEDGGHFGSTDKPIAYRVSGKCWVNNHAHVLKPKDYLNVDYLCYSLMFRDVSSIVNGATRQKLTQADMREIEIPLPALNEQHAIVDNLNKIFTLISLRKQQLLKLDELVKSRFVELFGSIKNNHQRYPVVKIGSCAKLQGGFAFKSSDYLNDGIRLVQISNVNKDTLDWDSINCVPQAFLQKYKDFELHVGDLVLAMTRPVIKSLDAVKIATVSENDVPSLLNQRVGRFVVDRKKLHSVYLMVLCQMPEFREYVEAMSGNSLQPNISSKQVEDYSIVLPPLALQEQFATFVEQVDKSKFEIQKSLEKLETLKKALMQKYFG